MAESKERSHYWQQVGSVVLGAVIAAAASGLVTHLQGRSQQKQFMLDKQLTLLKEYSASFNQQSWGVLSIVRKINARLFTAENLKEEGAISETEMDGILEEVFKNWLQN